MAMYKITSKISQKNGYQLADSYLKPYKFEKVGDSHIITERSKRSLERKYKNLLSNYVTIEKVAEEKPVVKEEVVRVEPTPIEEKSLVDMGYRELSKEIRQMSKEACEMLMEQENAKDEPRGSVIKEIEKRLKKLNK